jgi:hypothetical protein
VVGSSLGEDDQTTQSDATHQLNASSDPLQHPFPPPLLPHRRELFTSTRSYGCRKSSSSDSQQRSSLIRHFWTGCIAPHPRRLLPCASATPHQTLPLTLHTAQHSRPQVERAVVIYDEMVATDPQTPSAGILVALVTHCCRGFELSLAKQYYKLLQEVYYPENVQEAAPFMGRGAWGATGEPLP